MQAIHLGSRRVPRKLLERLGAQTLLEIGLGKLKEIQRIRGVQSVFAVSYADRELRDVTVKVADRRLSVRTLPARHVQRP